MLLQFTVSNFRSFKDAQTLNLAVSNYDKSLPQNCMRLDLPGMKGHRWLKGIAVYGPNAGGKSTLIGALRALAILVINSAKTTDPKDPIHMLVPFGLIPEAAKQPTAFAVVFVNDGKRYEYRLAATKERIIHESLRAFPTGKEQLWFCRDWNEESQTYDWSPEKPTGYTRDLKKEEFTLPNVLFLSKAISLGDTQLEPVFRWFKERLRFQDLSASGTFDRQGLETAKAFAKSDARASQITELLRHADLGVVTARVKLEEPDEVSVALRKGLIALLREQNPDFPSLDDVDPIPKIELSHSGPKGPTNLPWESESGGTHRLFAIAGPWLEILEHGYTVCIDELETSMHPLMVIALLQLLFSETTNPKGAQVIFTTHNPLLLDTTLLRRDQVWFADKDEHGATHLYPLTDYAPRKGESLVRGYLSGRYGAVPFIPRGLLGTRGDQTHDSDQQSK